MMKQTHFSKLNSYMSDEKPKKVRKSSPKNGDRLVDRFMFQNLDYRQNPVLRGHKGGGGDN